MGACTCDTGGLYFLRCVQFLPPLLQSLISAAVASTEHAPILLSPRCSPSQAQFRHLVKARLRPFRQPRECQQRLWNRETDELLLQRLAEIRRR